MRLDSALARLPAAQRREILLETQSHVADQARRSPMLSVPEILHELGAPDEYARTFLVDGNPAPTRKLGALHGLARLATGPWTGIPLLLFVVFCYSVGVLALLIALAELLEPETTGLFVHRLPVGRDISFVVSGPVDPTRGPDLLGAWLIPMGVGLALLIHLAMSALLRRVLPASTPRAS
jgi:hypothetical protein